MFAILTLISLYLLLFFVFVFFLAVLIRNNSIVDIIWGIGFVLIALLIKLYVENTLPRSLILLFVTLWGVRLAVHILLRNRGQGEDFRYRKWRAEWGDNWVLRTFFQVFLLQWLLMQVVALPIYLGLLAPARPLGILGAIGIGIWLIGFFFEAVGDYQLTLFKKSVHNRGQLMTTGLWRYTRHPNYFGEATLWWGVALLAYEQSGSLLVFAGPLLIDFLLLYVSGIPLLEKKYQGRADWEQYTKRTSPFFPLPPKNY